MTFASPDKLIWLLAALPIVVFYILKTRLKRRPVSTLLFWDQIFEQKRQRSLWQNLRHWMSLLLQLMLVCLLGLALADPLWKAQEDRGQDLILIVDNSASMRAVDPSSGLSRLQQAIEHADEIAGMLRPGDNIALITAGNSVRVVIGMSDFAPTVQETLRQIQPNDGPTRIAEAIAAARRLAADDHRRRIVVFSDGGIPDRTALFGQAVENSDDRSVVRTGPPHQSDEGMKSLPVVGTDVRWIQVGVSQDNVAITTFQVRRSTVDPIGYSLLVEVKNFSDAAIECRLRLELDEALVDVIPLQIEANGTYRNQIDSTSRVGGVLTGQLTFEDALQVDNLARAILPNRPEIPIRLFVGGPSESYYLKRVLESIPLVRIVEPEEPQSMAKLNVFAGVVPEVIPDGPVLFVAPPGDGPMISSDGSQAINGVPAWRLGDAIENPIIAKQEKQSTLLRHVQLQNVILAGGRDVQVDQALGAPTTLLETAGGAKVCVAIERNEGRVLLLAADLDTSDLPMRIAFPVLMTNAMNWFFRETGEIRPAIATGSSTNLPWDVPFWGDQSSATATLVAPSGAASLVALEKNRIKLGPLSEVGIYRLHLLDGDATAFDAAATGAPTKDAAAKDAAALETGDPTFSNATDNDDRTLIAVNLCDANESDLRLPALPSGSAVELPPARRSPWFYLIFAAVGLVIAEWMLFQRRIVA